MSNTPTTIYSLAQQYLQHRKIKLAHVLSLERVNKAIAASGVGLDHTIGEQVIAIGDDSYRDEFDMFFMLTDRRLAGRVLHQNRRKFFNIELDALACLQFDFLNPTVGLQQMSNPEWVRSQAAALGKTPQELAQLLNSIINVSYLPAAVIATPMKQALTNFLTAFNQTPVDSCLPQFQPLCNPVGDDPTGAEQLLQMVRHPQCITALQMVSAANKGGLLSSEHGEGFVCRVALAHRTATFGRGQKDGWWLSPLSQSDLIYSFFHLLGNPSYYHQQEGVQIYDFDVKKGGAGKAAVSSAVGLASAALLGVGWVSLPGKNIKNLRLKCIDTPPMSGFSIEGLYENNYVPIYAVRHDLFYQITELLVESELTLTMLRCAFGWQEPAPQLLMVPPPAVDARLKELCASARG